MATVVELEGVNGEWFTLAGQDAGDKGVWLSTDVKGLYEPPVKVVYETPGNWPGARYLNHRLDKRDITFAVEILHEDYDSWLSRESEWRKAWAFDRDCKLYVTTEESGTRWLKVRLAESPEVSWYTDPTSLTGNRTVMVCTALDPFWYSDDEVHLGVCKTDTTFEPQKLPWPWPKKKLPTETITITVPSANPTDNAIWPKWSVPGSTFAPAKPYVPGIPWLGAPESKACIWTLPDYSFQNDDQATRRVTLPALIGGLRTEEQQTIIVDGRPSAGTFTLTLGGETTTPLPFDASPAQIKTALLAFAGVAAGDVEVRQLAAVNETQTIVLEGGPTGGTFTLSLEGATTGPIPYNASALEVYTRIQALGLVGLVDVGVSVDYTHNCEQEIKLIGEPTAGSFTLTLDGQTTAPIPFNAANFQVERALRALPNIGVLAVNVTGSPIFRGGGPWDVKFQAGLAGVNINQITGDASGLSGGAGIAVVTKRTKIGGRKYRVTFRNKLGGKNIGEFTGNPAGLTGGDRPAVKVETLEEGSHPYQVQFVGNLSGKNMGEFTGDATQLSGCPVGVTPEILVAERTPGATAAPENAFIDSDPRVEQVISESGSQLWARMNGVRFKHPIPPYTGKTTFTVNVSGCVVGQSVALRLPRPWTRPWGLS